jgi:hypothetical protein
MGREQFLRPLLNSFEGIIQDKNFKILIILNGVTANVQQTYMTWAKNYPEQVEIIVMKQNNAGIAAFFPIIKDVKTDWICFPSDDDLIDVAFFSKWRDVDFAKAEFGVIATGLDLIDSQGNSMGIYKSPFYDSDLSFPENVARSLSECPFLWPGLIIRVNLIPLTGPSTRYVSDWWLGLYLMFKAQVFILNESFTHYRVHDGQESNVSSSSRKNFEALIHLGNFISSQPFTDWIESLEASELLDFLGFLIKYPPLYSDPNFSSEFTSIVTNVVRSYRSEIEIKQLATMISAFSHGVLVGSSELGYLDNSHISSQDSSRVFNFNFLTDDTCCIKVKSIPIHFNDMYAQFPTLTFGCSHSRVAVNVIKLDCINLVSQNQIYDSISQLGTEEFKRLDFFNNSVSRFEYSLVKKFRKAKYLFPPALTEVLFKILRK